MKQREKPELIDPIEIQESLRQLREEYPDPTKVAFVMMKFGRTAAHERIVQAIRSTLAPYGISTLRADEKQYHDDLFPNILTYVYGCGFGIAVFERIVADEFNPNVSLEVGYMFALQKPVCLLKDQTLKTLHVDLVGKLYKTFDPQDPINSIPKELTGWLRDKGIITEPPQKLSDEIMHPLLFASRDTNIWSPHEVDVFFRNLQRDAIDRARAEYDKVAPVRDEDIYTRATELIEKQVTAYGLRDWFDKWKGQGP